MKAEVLHLRTLRRQKLIGTREQALLSLELVLDVPLPLKKDRLPKGLGLELLGKQNTGH